MRDALLLAIVFVNAAACRPWDSVLCAPCEEGGCTKNLECVGGICVSAAERCGIGCGGGPACGDGFECFENTCRTPIDVAAGFDHTCVLWPSGRVSCWGDSREGQSGSLDSYQVAPRDIDELSDAIAISSHGASTCALRKNSDVVCWGSNDAGQLGNYSGREDVFVDRAIPQTVTLDAPARIVGSGFGHHCAQTNAGELSCWGDNDNDPDADGQPRRGCVLGDQEVWNSVLPLPVTSSVAFEQLHGGAFHMLGVAQGRVYGWGVGADGQLAGVDQSCAPRDLGFASVEEAAAGYRFSCLRFEDGSVRCFGSAIPPDYRALLREPISQLRAGGETACGILGVSGSVACWGSARTGLLGGWEHFAETFAPPTIVPGTERTDQLAVGFNGHACLIRDGDGVYCWGRKGPHVRFATALHSADARAIALGRGYVCLVEGSGRVSCSGSNAFGELGRGIVSRSEPFAEVAGISARDVKSGMNHVCALDNEGGVWCWGHNFYGQVGGGKGIVVSPRRVEGLPRAISVHLGWWHSCAITETHEAYCWGNNYGAPRPIAVEVVQLGAGDNHTCILKGGGEIVCAGDDRDQSLRIEDAVELAGGSSFDCARTGSGAVWCWGSGNEHSRLGDGTVAMRENPRRVFHLDDAEKITALFDHTCALRRSGEVVCWGEDASLGRLGIGPTRDQPKPVTVTGVPNAIDVVAGRDMSCAIDRDHRAWCWGYDEFGQISGEPAFSTSPERVRFAPGR